MPTRIIRLHGALILSFILTMPAGAQTRTRQNLADILGFENGQPGAFPAGWTGTPANTIVIDDKVFHGGKYSARIERTASSSSTFSTLTTGIPLDFLGKTIEWRGFLKTENVSDAVAIWLREDGDTPNLAFATTQTLGVKGTTDWKEYSITLPVATGAKQLAFGVLLIGTGKVWADDLRLLVDGRPVAEGPPLETLPPVFASDREFDGGSRINLKALTDTQVQNLATLGKVWGFLKYHHPQVTGGRRHWDYDLFRILPRVLAAEDSPAANQAIAEWIASLGPVAECTDCATLDTSRLQSAPNLGWLEDEALLGSDLSQTLRSIHRNRTPAGSSFYVSMKPGAMSPVFENELSYPALKLPDTGYQLLALFRFWNIVEFFNPNRGTMADDPAEAATYWDRVMKESVPAVALAQTSLDYQRELMKFIARVNDTNANLWSSLASRPPVGPCMFSVGLRFMEGKAMVVRFNTVSGDANFNLRLGDIIDGLDGVTVNDLVKLWSPAYSASNEAARLRDIANTMSRGACGNAVPAVLYNGVPFLGLERRVAPDTLDMSANSNHDRPGNVFQLLSKDVAYLKLSSAEAAKSASYIQSASGAKSLIIDIRNSPAEAVLAALAPLLISEPVDFVRPTSADVINPGAFHWGPPLKLMPQQPHYAGKVVILVDELTQGQGEIAAMAFRAAPGAIVVGSTTAGAAGNSSAVPLPGGLNSSISGNGVFYPDNTPTQRVGIIPDIEVKSTLDMFSHGRDELLEAAMGQITGNPWPAPLAAGPLVADLGAGVRLDFVQINPGDFMMGCSPTDTLCAGNPLYGDNPPHPVRITKTFQMGKFEVTRAQWQALLGGGSPLVLQQTADRPVEVTWNGLQPFLQKMNDRKDGFLYRLPTEAEWEYAARAGSQGPTYGKLDDIAWYNLNTPGKESQPVGKKLPNAWGLHDTLGNVSEWVQDWYSEYQGYSLSSPTVDPQGISGAWPRGAGKVGRGGAFDNPGHRVSERGFGAPSLYAGHIGFRLVRERLDGGAVPRLSEFLLSHNAVLSEGTVSGTVSLTSWALAGGTVVTLQSNNPSIASVPVSVTVPAGKNSATFTFAVRTVAANQQVVITARQGADLKTAPLTVMPALRTSLGPFDMQFIGVPAGEFIMGCSIGDTGCNGDIARLLVRLTKAFDIGKYEVTQAQWEAAMGSNPSAFKGADLPVEQVNWNDVQRFLTRLNERNDGFRYRLPTRAEWEYAARAGTTDRFAGGVLDDIAWYNSNCGANTNPVGTKKPNEWGLHDVLGNVWEWVQDWFETSFSYSTVAATDPLGPASGTSKMAMGGGWNGPAYSVSIRYASPPGQVFNFFGFRCVRERVAP